MRRCAGQDECGDICVLEYLISSHLFYFEVQLALRRLSAPGSQGRQCGCDAKINRAEGCGSVSRLHPLYIYFSLTLWGLSVASASTVIKAWSRSLISTLRWNRNCFLILHGALSILSSDQASHFEVAPVPYDNRGSFCPALVTCNTKTHTPVEHLLGPCWGIQLQQIIDTRFFGDLKGH